MPYRVVIFLNTTRLRGVVTGGGGKWVQLSQTLSRIDPRIALAQIRQEVIVAGVHVVEGEDQYLSLVRLY